MKKQFLILFAFISVLALSQVPQRFNKVIITGDIVSPKFIKTGSNADSVLLGNGSARSVNSLKTDTVSLSNRINAKAAGNGTANGTNTGDETLTSIKTKLGAATSVSDGYLKYQDWSVFNSKEPAITKNTAFNKNFGTTTGTVLEGRTFGTAANSAVGDFIQNQNSSAQTANMWISGVVKTESASILNRASLTSATPLKYSTSGTDDWFIGQSPLGNSTKNLSYYSYGLGDIVLDLNQTTGAATFSSTVNSTGFLLNGNNLTSSLSTNYIPKWNGSNFVNATAGTDYQLPITLTTNGTSGAATFSGNVLNVPNYGAIFSSGTFSPTLTNISNVSSSGFTSGVFSKVGSVYTLSGRGVITSSGAGMCSIRMSLPATALSLTNYSFTITATDSGSTQSKLAYMAVIGAAKDTITIYVNSTAGGETNIFYFSGQYVAQ